MSGTVRWHFPMPLDAFVAAPDHGIGRLEKTSPPDRRPDPPRST